jgi:hypothetical protein
MGFVQNTTENPMPIIANAKCRKPFQACCSMVVPVSNRQLCLPVRNQHHVMVPLIAELGHHVSCLSGGHMP